jgi:AcrR family transcriptional regulator
VTVQDILDRADVGRSTFYSHFHDKDELLRSGFERMYPALAAHRDAALGGSGFIDDMPLELMRHMNEQRPLFKALLGKQSGSMLLAHVQDYLAAYAIEVMNSRFGDATPEVPLEVVARFATGSFMTMVVWWLETDSAYSPEEMAEMLKVLIIPGVHAVIEPLG